ncbi:hypothetical protein LUZ60_014612 [Juncus effusus]|nr:hypothetical protein LUZ60_014612 [Juncus effusus]
MSDESPNKTNPSRFRPRPSSPSPLLITPKKSKPTPKPKTQQNTNPLHLLELIPHYSVGILVTTMEKKLYKEKLYARPWRWVKTVFFLLTMLASLLLVCAPPLLIIVLDLLLPPALVSSSLSGSPSFSAQLRGFSFRSSVIDLPLISIARSLLILCAYAICDGRGAYLGITTLCSLSSIGYVFVKGIAMFRVKTDTGGGIGTSPSTAGTGEWWYRFNLAGKDGQVAVEALFFISIALAVAHINVAYRTSCRERKKLLVYRIDIEAVKLKAVQIKGSR